MLAGTSPRVNGKADWRGWSRLMAGAQDGDHQAYRRLLEEIAPYLQRLARRRLRNSEDVEDVVQDILLAIHAIRHTYDPHRPFGPWFVTIASHRIANHVRRRAYRLTREVALRPEHVTLEGGNANLPDVTVDGHRLRSVVESLPPAQRWAIKLLKLQEMSLKEAAKVSGMSVAALKTASHRALKALRVRVVPHED